MSFNIEIMRGAMKFGGARPALFDVQINNPVDPSALADIPLKAKATTQPPSTLGEVLVYYKGRSVKLAGDRTYDDWTVTFYCDEDYVIKNSFERWSNAINSAQGNARNGVVSQLPVSYKTDAYFFQRAKNTTLIKAYKLIGCWPKMVGQMQNDWETSNQILTVEITFSYDYCVSDTTDGFFS